jgi:hypothetical protein
MLVTLCSIWTARRKAIHEGEFQTPLTTHHFVRNFFYYLALIPKPKSPASQTTAQSTKRKWIPPSDDHAKANVDRAVSEVNGKGSAAVVFRSKNGYYLGSSAVVFSSLTNPASLEALACREALALANDLLLQKITIAFDCQQVVTDIEDGVGRRYASIIRASIIRYSQVS